jgi:DNA-binding CsgD family transcriptional regulator
MIDRDRIRIATEAVVAAALLGEDWTGPLAGLAAAAGARDAVLMHNTESRTVTAVVTDEAAETVAAFVAGQAPPSSRYARVRIGPQSGFRVDFDDYSDEELKRDPFYQEFLQPAGVFWHANAVLHAGHCEHVELSFKRRKAAGPYSRDDAETLDVVLPDLRAASRITRQMLDAEARGVVRVLKNRGLLTLEIDRWGRVLASHEGSGNRALPVDVINRQIVAVDRSCQAGLDRALAVALQPDSGRIALAALNAADGRRYILQVHPLPNRARDVFLAASAVAVLIDRDRPAGHSLSAARHIAPVFGLTEREAEVACLRAEGLEFPAIAALLKISPDTARTYLKYVYDKIGVSRQAELVALITRLLD